jgi:hypothetical protein
MKRFLLFISILALVMLPIGCVDVEGITQGVIDNITRQATGTYTIKVGGTEGLNFTGEYLARFYEFNPDTSTMDFSTDSYSVDGQVPEEYSFEAMAAGGLFQKQSGNETLLRVEIWKDGVLQDSANTTAPWGAVMVAGGP